jgi:hypothetical protein
MSKKNAPESASTAKIITGNLNRDQMVATTRERAKRIKDHPDFATVPALATSVAKWEASADQLEALSHELATLRMRVVAVAAEYDIEVAAWKRKAKNVRAAIDDASGGSAAAIKAWGFEVNSRASSVATVAAPTGLRATYDEGFTLVARWNAVKHHRGYLVQLGDPNADAWQEPIPCPTSRFAPPGMNPGQKIAVRVAVVRHNGVSAWSDPAVMTAH